jgi:hypothetical protein
MYAYARLSRFTWEPPKLDSTQELILARAVRDFGVWRFIKRFVGLASEDLAQAGFDWRTFFELHGFGLMTLLFITVGLAFAGDTRRPFGKQDTLGDAAVPILCLGFLGGFVFYCSLLVCTCRYALWLGRVKRKHFPRADQLLK